MEIKISSEELRKRKLFVSTPMYGIEMKTYFLYNESLITRARNYCSDEFLRSDCTHMLFIDSDIGFDPNDVIAMLALMSDDTEYDIMAGPYPKKCITWEKVKGAVDKGFADKDSRRLEDFVGDFVFNPVVPDAKNKKGGYQIRLDEPAEVLEAGTGFMMMRRKTFEKFLEAYPHLSYKPDHVRTEQFDGSRYIHAFFDTVIDRGPGTEGEMYNLVKEIVQDDSIKMDPDAVQKKASDLLKKMDAGTDRYLSEDYMFCQYVRQAGMKVWMCPWMHLTHTGSYVFQGKLAALAAIGAAATADKSLIKKGAINLSPPSMDTKELTKNTNNDIKKGNRKSRRKATSVSRKRK
jgi:hypothetical protein